MNALLDPELDNDMICTMQPVNVEHNVVFIIDLGELKNVKDLYCNDMGSWQYNGVYHSWLTVDDIGFVSTLGKQKPAKITSNMYYVTKKYFVHRTSSDLKKIVVILSGEAQILSTGTCWLIRQHEELLANVGMLVLSINFPPVPIPLHTGFL